MAVLRSLLFIPGDSEKKLGKVDACGPDAVILDLEDSVAAANKPAANKPAPEVQVGPPPAEAKPAPVAKVAKAAKAKICLAGDRAAKAAEAAAASSSICTCVTEARAQRATLPKETMW